MIIPTQPVGVGRQVNLTRNGQLANAPAYNKVAEGLNTILGRRNKILFKRFIHPNDVESMTGAGSVTYFYGQWHTSPNISNVEACIISCVGSQYSPAGTPDPSFQWVITDGTPTDHTQTEIFRGDYSTHGSSVFPKDLALHYQTMKLTGGAGGSLAGNTTYTSRLTVKNGARVAGVILYERPKATLDSASDTCVVPVSAGQPILATQLTQVFTAVETIWERQGTVHVCWAHPTGAGQAITSTSYRNVLTATDTGAWGADDYGLWIYPYTRGTYNTAAVPCVFWVRASASGANTGSVRFTWGSGGSENVEITGIDAAAGYYTTTSSNLLDTIAATGTNVVIEAKDSAGTITVYSAGMYEYQA